MTYSDPKASINTMTWHCLVDAGKPCIETLDSLFQNSKPNNDNSQDDNSQDDNSHNDNDNAKDDKNNSNTIAISPSDRAYAYGDGFFTTIGVRQGQALWLAQHQQRLASHLLALQLHLPQGELDRVWAIVATTAQRINSGILKIVISRQTQVLRGYAFSSKPKDNACHVWLGVMATQLDQNDIKNNLNDRPHNYPVHADILAFAKHCSKSASPYYSTPIPIQNPITAVCLLAQLSCQPANLVGLKTLNRLDNVLAAGELERCKHTFAPLAHIKNGVGEGLVKDVSGQWVEGVMSNFFYQLSSEGGCHQWYTPPIDISGVNGVMRQVLILAAQNLEVDNSPVQPTTHQHQNDSTYIVLERRLQDNDLPKLSHLFFCNAVRGIIPVAHLINLQGDVVEFKGSDTTSN